MYIIYTIKMDTQTHTQGEKKKNAMKQSARYFFVCLFACLGVK